MDKVNSEYSETKRQGVHLLIATITAIVSYIVVNILLMIAGANFLLALCEAIVGLILIGSVIAVIIRIFLLLVNVIKDIFSLPGKAIKKAKEVKAQKEREQAEAELQAKIDAEAAPYKAMADNGDTTAMKEIAKVYYKNGKEKEARDIYEKAASKGDVGAQLALAQNYKQIGTAISVKWASCVESNPRASEEQKESARNQKQAIAEYEQYLDRKQDEAREQKRRQEEAYQAWRQKELQTPVTGDYFVPRTYGETCRNQGSACRYCARRAWHPGGWGDDDCRIGM